MKEIGDAWVNFKGQLLEYCKMEVGGNKKMLMFSDGEKGKVKLWLKWKLKVSLKDKQSCKFNE